MSYKNRIYSLAGGLALLGFVASCAKDRSTDASYTVSRIVVNAEDALKSSYTLEQFDTQLFVAPRFHQEGMAKEVSYRWELNGEVVSTDSQWSFTADKPGDYQARLTITNEDGHYYHPFTIKAQYAYRDGLYILASKGGSTQLAYVQSGTHRAFEDVASASNPTNLSFLAGEPVDFTYSNRGLTGAFVLEVKPNVSTSNSRFLKLDINDMTLLGTKNKPVASRALFADKTDTPDQGNPIFLMESSGKFTTLFAQNDLSLGGNLIFEGLLEDLPSRPNAVSLSPVAVVWRGNRVYNSWQYMFFDEANASLYHGSKNMLIDLSSVYEYFQRDLTNKRILSALTVEDYTEVLVLTQDKANPTDYQLLWFYPGSYTGSNASSNMGVWKDTRSVTGHIDDQSVLASSNVEKVLFYSKGLGVYAYRVNSLGDFPSAPIFSVDAGETIVSMTMSKDSKLLYVATNSAGTGKVGNIYIYDVTDLRAVSLVQKLSEVTGSIKKLLYRPVLTP